jgi:hypothetical protein
MPSMGLPAASGTAVLSMAGALLARNTGETTPLGIAALVLVSIGFVAFPVYLAVKSRRRR